MIEKTTELRELECALEAVLFAAGDSVSEGKLCAVLDCDKLTLRTAAQNLADYYDFNLRGIKLLKLDDRYQLASRADYAQAVRSTLETRKPQNLTPAALEVLAIVAYKQPVTKGEIEAIRGIKCDRVIEGLTKKSLVAEVGRSDAVGRPILYGTTDEFLKQFGFETLKELPAIEDIEGVLSDDDSDTAAMDSMYMQQISLELPEKK